MMTAEETPVSSGELMIGNWVEVDSNYEQVNSISNPWIETTTFHMVHDFKGIPLTPEILEKFGFVQNEYLVFTLRYFTLCHYSDGYAYFDGANKIGNGINYLHQLQNLYFALTGTHLTINLLTT